MNPASQPTLSKYTTLLALCAISALASLLGACSAPDEPARQDTANSAQTATCPGLDGSDVLVDLMSDDSNCGACGIGCAAGSFCAAGKCAAFCVAGQQLCGDSCVGVLSDPQNCGACDNSCAAGQLCDNGQCSSTCSGGICQGSSGSECVHLDSNPGHCGACNNACPSGSACVAGACEQSCPASRTACGSSCVDVTSSALHCGQCGNSCPNGVACEDGICGGSAACPGGICACPSGSENCSGACIDTSSNVFHCGQCGQACASAQSCVDGVCSCPSGGELCGESCVDTQNDNQNCGQCGAACSGSRTCVQGSCACTAGLNDCSGQCVNTTTSVAHCGGCGVTCDDYESCVDGTCVFDDDSCGGKPSGIEISRVALYQAVELDLYKNAGFVSPAQRAVDVIEGRQAMVRVFVTPQSGYLAQELSARLFIQNGTEVKGYFSKRKIVQASSQGQLASTLNIEIPASAIQKGSQYWVELATCAGSASAGSEVLRLPAADTIALEARDTGVVKLGMIPVKHAGRLPDTSNVTLAVYARTAELLYPTSKVELVDLSTMWNRIVQFDSGQSSGFSLGQLLDDLTDQRYDDLQAGLIDPEVYYYGLVDPASSFSSYCQGSCTTGIGWVPAATGYYAELYRVAVGIGFGTRGSGTFAHELGHNLGRDHAPCGGAGGPDPSFPYSGGRIGKWGYDLDGAALKDPSSFFDFMGYCSPDWISDYNYNAIADRIATVNSGAPQVTQTKTSAMLTWWRVLVTEQGVRWLKPQLGPMRVDGALVRGAAYDASGAVLEELELYRIDRSEGAGYVLYVPEPELGWFAVGQLGEVAAVY